MEITSDTCATYIQVRRMAYVPDEMQYCRNVCNGTKEMCQHEDHELTFRSIGSTQKVFRKGDLAMVVMASN